MTNFVRLLLNGCAKRHGKLPRPELWERRSPPSPQFWGSRNYPVRLPLAHLRARDLGGEGRSAGGDNSRFPHNSGPGGNFSLLTCTLTLLVLAALALFGPISPPVRAQTAAASPAVNSCAVAGDGFSVQTLQSGAPAFANRAYVWADVPPSLAGWQVTQTNGGKLAHVCATPDQSGFVYAATAAENGPLPGWEARPSLAFHYSDAHATPMSVFRRLRPAGAAVDVPQRGWTGTLVLAPRLSLALRPPPGVVVDYSPPQTRSYVGSPAIAVLPNGNYVAAHDCFGPGARGSETRVFGSHDRGQTWQFLTNIAGQWWSTLFVHDRALYLLGVTREFGSLAIRRSDDGGKTWTTPATPTTGLLATDGHFHCAPVPIVEARGRLWRAMEMLDPQTGGRHFLAFMLFAPVNADLLNAQSWTRSAPQDFSAPWRGDNWLEGNAVVTPEGDMVDILRTGDPAKDHAAVLHISPDGAHGTFDPVHDLFAFPGGSTKFTIRYDPATRLYWSLVNPQHHPDAQRNILALTSSPDLRAWTIHAVILQDPDPQGVAFQYVDWLFDGDDIIFVSRTAFNNAHSYHDADYLTFHRIAHFRPLAAKGVPATP